MNQIRTILVSGSVPTVNQLALGDIAINTVDGKAFLKKYSGSVETVIEIGAGITPISASYAITASYAQTATTASYFSGSISNAISASYAATASTAETAQNILVYCKNQSGYTIDKGMVVRITGSNNSSDIPRIISASYENDNNSANTLGIANESISNGNEGFVMTEGVLKGIDTNAYISGQLLYLGPTGSITGSAPRAPLHAVRLGEVIRHQSINGSIYVRIDNGYELGELHDVLDNTTTGSYGDLLIKSGSVWTNSKQLTGSYGLTGSFSISGSIVAPSFTGSFTGSFSGSFTGSLFGTASNALTASYLNPLAQTVRLTGSLIITGSVLISSSATFINVGPAVFTGSAGTGSAVTVYKSGSTAFDIQGSSGQLFAVTDSLTGSLFSVNTAAGLPVIEAFSDNTVNIGKFGTYPIKVAATGTLAIITGSFTGSFTGSGLISSASYAATSSFPWFQTGSNIAYVGNNIGIAETNPRLRFTINTPGGGYWISMDRGNTTEGGNTPTWAVFNNADPASATYGWAWYDSSADGSFSLWRRNFSTTSSLVVKFDRNNSNTSFAANVRITGSGTNSLLVKGSGTTSATTALRIENSSASPSLAVLDNGFVGIRKSNPTVALDVSGSVFISGSVTIGSSTGIILYDNGGAGGGRIYGSYNYGNGEIYIQPLGSTIPTFVFSPTNGMSIGGFTIGGTTGSPPAYGLAVSGSVGIGTRVPAFKLDVSGSGRFTGGLTVTGSTIAKGDFTVTGATTTDINTSTLNINAPLFTVPSFATPYSPSATVRVVMYDAVSNALFVTASTAASPVIVNTIATGSITASVQIGPAATVPYFFLVQSGSVEMLKINAERVMVLEARTTVPTAVTGGIYYSASGDFYFGM